jgi:hypothetical protein
MDSRLTALKADLAAAGKTVRRFWTWLLKARYQKADVRGVGVSFVFIPMGQSPRQKIAPNVSRIKAIIPMINNELKQHQSRRNRLIENILILPTMLPR